MNDESKLEINKLKNEVSQSLLAYAKSAIDEQVKNSNDEYTIGYGSEWRFDSNLNEDISKKYGIQFLFIDKTSPISALAALITLSGRLGEIFKDHNIPPYIVIGILTEPGVDCLKFKNTADFERIYLCSLLYQPAMELDNLSAFVEEIRKVTLFARIKMT